MARKTVPIPLLKIDDPMAIEAVNIFSRIGVLATLPTTLEPTANLLKSVAADSGKEIQVTEGLAEGAFEAVMSGDRETHDNLILEASEIVADKVEVIVLAQGSMARMEKKLVQVSGKPVLSSPESGVLGVKSFIEKQGIN